MPDSKLRQVFRKYKIDNFPYPLYYCLPYGLRFELGREVEGAEALARAEEIFAAAFPKNHEMLIVLETEAEGKVKKALSDFESAAYPVEHYDSETGELTVYTRTVYAVPAHSVPHTVLFSAILADEETYGSRIYFADVENGMIMMLYDHRGLDLAAPQALLLSSIYREKKHLLSIIDLPQMKLNFED
ncbi:MAG: hypothetical protein IKY33_01725 [Clostridia bacterium]|nr:hypothetical protein [Clostridia bacterium]